MSELSKTEILQKITAFCAYQERSTEEVITKLQSWDVSESEQQELLFWLEEENFLNEKRFVSAFIRGKFRIKQWGRLKIIQHLKLRNIPLNAIKEGLTEIQEAEYREVLANIIRKKYTSLQHQPTNSAKLKKVIQFALSKGYESAMVWEIAQEIHQEIEREA